ncbi:VWA domain-containing protein [Candidatus Babeliales bacterium]|nr:VWA domain-containing protein [Candidatus Babeliales bacterium]
MYFLRFAYYKLFYFLIPVFLLVFLYRLKFYKTPVYSFSLGDFFKKKFLVKKSKHKKIFFFLRSLSLLGLIFLIARPQWIDSRSKVNIEGVDMILAIDVSGSMQVFDDVNDRRSRIKVAKDEAIRFIEKRENDPIGIVIFAKDAISCCPLTLDKNILKEIVGKLELGYINPDGTSIGTGLATAVNRLRKSKAKSKIIVLLTDGEPTPEKIEPHVAIELAKEFGIKIYTIGIGNEKGGFIKDTFFGIRRVGFKIDVTFLKKIADQTGGKFFRANNPAQLRRIYEIIDSLEKTEYQTDIFHRYYEAFLNFIWIILLIFGLEIFLRFYFWRGIHG